MKKLNILHLSTLALWDLGKGKGRVSTILPIKGFVDKGHNVCYITDNKTQAEGNIEGIKVIYTKPAITNQRTYVRLLLLPIITFYFVRAALKQAKKQQPDIIYAHTTDTALAAFIASKFLKTKYVLRLYGIGNSPLKPFKPSGVLLRIGFYAKADAYILTNDGTAADKFALSHKGNINNVFFLKNGIDKFIAKINGNRHVVTKKENAILSISRLSNSKQVHLIIQAFYELCKVDTKTQLIIIGDGPEKDNLQNLANQLQIENHITFVGALPQKQIFEYMHHADLFISMNALSSMSNPVFEAMICGRTVVALNKGTTRDLIEHNVNGIIIEENDIKNLPILLHALLQDKEKRDRIGNNAQAYMLAHWPSWEDRVQQEIDIIENLCDK